MAFWSLPSHWCGTLSVVGATIFAGECRADLCPPTDLQRMADAHQLSFAGFLAVATSSQRNQHLGILGQRNLINLEIDAIRPDTLAGSQIECPIVQRTNDRSTSEQSVSKRAIAMRTCGLRRIDLSGMGSEDGDLLLLDDKSSALA